MIYNFNKFYKSGKYLLQSQCYFHRNCHPLLSHTFCETIHHKKNTRSFAYNKINGVKVYHCM